MRNTRLDIDTTFRIVPTILDGSILRDAKLGGSFLAGATFAGTDLTQADFSKDETEPVIFSEKRIINGEEVILGASLVGANLTNADFESADLSYVNMQGADLEGTLFKFANLSFANLEGANLFGSDLRGANMQNADLTSATLHGANLAGANLSDAILESTTFRETTLVSINPITFPVDLSYADLILALAGEDCLNGIFLLRQTNELTPVKIDFSESLVKGFYDSGEWRSAVRYICPVDMSGVRLRGRARYNQYAAGINFSNADLQNTDLTKMTLVDILQVDNLNYRLSADLTGVLYNEFTVWPTGVIPPPLPEAQPQAELEPAG